MKRGLSMRLALAAGLLAITATAAMAAKPASKAWFGVKPPPGLEAPSILGQIKAKGFAVKPAVVPPGENNSPEFKGAAIQRDLVTVVDFGLKPKKAGAQFWGRVSGYPGETDTANWVADQFKAAGLSNVQVQTYDATAPFWQPTSWEVRVIADPSFGAGTKDVVLQSAVPTSGSLIDGPALKGPVIYIGDVGPPAKGDVKGKIVIQHTKPAKGAYSDRSMVTQSAQALNKAGALAVINWIEQPGNMHVNDFGRCGGVCFNIGGADGAFLKAVLDKAGAKPVTMSLKLEAAAHTGLKAQNVIGLVPGASPEIVVVNAHLDSWFDGAGDNGDGVAVLVALARHYGKPQNKPARTLLFVGSGGHHSPGLGGPPALLKMNPDLLKPAVLVLNLEHVAQFQLRPDPWRVDPTEEPKQVGVSNMAPFLVQAIRTGAARYGYTYDPNITESVPGDLGGYAPLGIARVQGIHSGPLYHTSGDVVGSISTPGLERAARFYAWFIDQVAKAPKDQVDPPGSAPAPSPARRGG